MDPRFAGDLGLADAVTVVNATLGFGAVAALLGGVGAVDLAARLILLAAITDGLDGVVARHRGGTDVGPYLDSLADVASFAVAPAATVVAFVAAARSAGSPVHAAAVGAGALFVAMAVVRLALYTARDTGDDRTLGVQSTLAATVLAAAVLAGTRPLPTVAATGLLAALMVTRIPYPDLLARDALLMGGVQALAVLAPEAAGGVFPFALLAAALAYLLFAPRFYWRERKRS